MRGPLGFNQGALLEEDPDDELLGTAQNIRHLSLKSQADLTRPQIRLFFRRSSRARARRCSQAWRAIFGGEEPGTVMSTVKAIYKRSVVRYEISYSSGRGQAHLLPGTSRRALVNTASYRFHSERSKP